MSTEQNREPTEDTGREESAVEAGDSPDSPIDFSQLPLELKVAVLSERLEAAEANSDKYRSEVQYKEAELQNERRRFAEQRAASAKYRDEDLLLDLLPVIEGLELALNAEISEQWETVSSWPCER